MNEQFQMDRLCRAAGQGVLRPPAARREHLRSLLRALEKHETALHAALRADLGKPETEAFTTETGFVQSDIRYALKHLHRWSRPRFAAVPPLLMPARARIIPEPKGIVLIIGPWNYPVQLILSPLVAALSAGNCALLKPSELAPHTAAALQTLIDDAFEPDTVQLVQGGRETAEMLLAQPFNHIFFTGGTEVGRKVAEAAAKQLIPVTLELGGKCPAIVCADANLEVTARRIARGKFTNAGQTCVAPDHVWVPRDRMAEFCRCLESTILQFYGPDPQKSPDYGRIISRPHVERLQALWPECICRPAERYVAPAVIADPPAGSPLMQEEIFGPLLPVIPYDDEQQVVEWCRSRPVPLALYLFTNSRAKAKRLMETLPSGGVCINDTVMHLLPKALPFGGRGASGIGAYHGKRGFDEFSHFRSVLTRSTKFDLRAAYPPLKISLASMKRACRLLAGD